MKNSISRSLSVGIKENVDVSTYKKLIPYSSSARRKEKENVDVCTYKKLPYSSSSARIRCSLRFGSRKRFVRKYPFSHGLPWVFSDKSFSTTKNGV